MLCVLCCDLHVLFELVFLVRWMMQWMCVYECVCVCVCVWGHIWREWTGDNGSHSTSDDWFHHKDCRVMIDWPICLTFSHFVVLVRIFSTNFSDFCVYWHYFRWFFAKNNLFIHFDYIETIVEMTNNHDFVFVAIWDLCPLQVLDVVRQTKIADVMSSDLKDTPPREKKRSSSRDRTRRDSIDSVSYEKSVNNGDEVSIGVEWSGDGVSMKSTRRHDNIPTSSITTAPIITYSIFILN